MATPSSSATSESPPLAFLQATPVTAPSTLSNIETAEKEERKRAVKKFMARAEISMVTRGLRTRLSYASYKATHNIPHIPLRDLEAQSFAQHTPAAVRVSGAKRKVVHASAPTNHYNNPATSNTSARRGAMAPPQVGSRSHAGGISAPATRSANAAQSLYSSILSPPPAKQARTIHNAGDPPLSAPARSSAVSRGRTQGGARSIAEGTRAQSRSRREEESRRKDKGKKGKEREREGAQGRLASGEMKAAETLTSLLLSSRPSLTGSMSSPRSSVSGVSDVGSSQSYAAHFAQSSARTTSAAASANSSFASTGRPATPPPLSGADGSSNMTPKPLGAGSQRPHSPSDNEAADLMLLFATSPSPARPTTTREKDAKDSAAFRALGGGESLRAKGRVLFPTSDSGGGTSGDGLSDGLQMLSRGRDSSTFGSSVETVGDVVMSDGTVSAQRTPKHASRLAMSATLPDLDSNNPAPTGTRALPMDPTVILPISSTPQLLPPPPSPSARRPDQDSSQLSASSSWSSLIAPRTPGTVSFNMNDFINVSPSPAAGLHGKSNLRADVGRRLFEEEQQRHQAQAQGLGLVQMSGFGGELGSERGASLGAGIDLVQS